jgi:uncharacterized protein
MMKLEEYLGRLRDHEGDLRARGIRHAAVCGCVTRGEDPEGGCVAILADFDPRQHLSDFDIAAVEQYLEYLLGCRVELDSPTQMRREKCSAVLREAVNAF